MNKEGDHRHLSNGHKPLLITLLLLLLLFHSLIAAAGDQPSEKAKVLITFRHQPGPAESFDVFRDDTRITSGITANAYTDNTGLKGGGSYLYQVREAGNPANCSNVARVGF